MWHFYRKVLKILTAIGLFSLIFSTIYTFDFSANSSVQQPSDREENWECKIWPDYQCLPGNKDRSEEQYRFLNQYARSTKGKVRSPKTILTDLFNATNSTARLEMQRQLSLCPISDCIWAVDDENSRKTVDAVLIFTMREERLEKFLPKPSHQIWIAYQMEPPRYNRITDSVNHYINWSIAYRPDSHIWFPYSQLSYCLLGNTQPTAKQINVNFAAGRKNWVAWLVSNCRVNNGRLDYANELNRFIRVDIYGRCSKLKCPKIDTCHKMLAENYKFYLAFENSNCNYYITEKIFKNAYRNNVIPIVMGARPEDYAALLPPHSYIHVDDFESPGELAIYLHKLDANDTLYNEYFQWKTHWKSRVFSWMCRLCGLLHVSSELNYVHWYQNYSLWRDGDQDSHCDSHWKTHNGLRWQSWNVK